jgi:F0F1-type ATP synthase epsilon subunit
MNEFKPLFKLTVLSPNELIYENEVYSVFLVGEYGEFEILAYHYPLISIVKKSDVIINWNERLPVKKGVVRFFANECSILVEEEIATKKAKTN